MDHGIRCWRALGSFLWLSALSWQAHAATGDMAADIAAMPEPTWQTMPRDMILTRIGVIDKRCGELESLAARNVPRANSIMAGAIIARKCGPYDTDRALSLARKASATGDRRGLIFEATVHWARRNYPAAVRILSLPELASNPLALKLRGDANWFGYGLPANKAVAMSLYRAAEAQNDPTAMTMLAWIAQEGLSGKADPVAAEARYRKAAALGYVEALTEHGSGLLYGKFGVARRIEAQPFLEKAASLGSGRAATHLGFALVNGAVLPRDVTRGLAILDKASADGNPEPIAALGQLYRGGLGIPRDHARAVAVLQKAADSGDAVAWRMLHYEYTSAEATADERAMAMIAIEKASQLGDDLALNEIGVAYELGVLVPKSNQTALYFYQRAAGKGVPSGHYNLGRMHHYGLSAARDLKVAEKEYALAVAGGWTNAVAPLQQVRRELAAQTAPRPATPRLAVAAPAAPKAAAGKSAAGAPTAKQIQDALVYENAFGRVTGADAMGLIKRSADYANGISRAVTMGITAETVFRVANARCSAAGKGRYACAYDLSMKTLGVPWSGRGSHTFARQGGTWRSPTYLAAIIKAGNQSAANQKEPCVLTGFGTLQGPHLENKSGGYCTH